MHHVLKEQKYEKSDLINVDMFMNSGGKCKRKFLKNGSTLSGGWGLILGGIFVKETLDVRIVSSLRAERECGVAILV
jgi:hypothetical protein